MSARSLADLGCGEFGEVTSLTFVGGMRRRLQDIGIIPGTLVECLIKSPLGDPSAYLVRGAVIALRRDTSCCVLVKPVRAGKEWS